MFCSYCIVQDGNEARCIAQRSMTQEIEGIPSHIRGHTPVYTPLSNTGLCLCSMSYILNLAATAGATSSVKQGTTPTAAALDNSSSSTASSSIVTSSSSNSNNGRCSCSSSNSTSSSSIAVLNYSEHALPLSTIAALTAAGASNLQLLVSLSKRAQHKDYWQTDVLPRALRFIAAALQQQQQCLVVCSTGTDVSAAVCIAAMVALQLINDCDGVNAGSTTADGDSIRLNGTAQHTIEHSAEQTAVAGAVMADSAVVAEGTSCVAAVSNSSALPDDCAHQQQQQQPQQQQQRRQLHVRQGAVRKETIRSEFLQLESWCGDAKPQRRFMIELNKFFIPEAAGWVRGGVRDALLALVDTNNHSDAA
jgi:Rit1 DUSP-like domain